MIPMLTHVDNLNELSLDVDMSAQEQSLETIANNTGTANTSLSYMSDQIRDINMIRLRDLVLHTSYIREASTNTATSVGTTADADTATTVIGLLKSIVNKLS